MGFGSGRLTERVRVSPWPSRLFCRYGTQCIVLGVMNTVFTNLLISYGWEWLPRDASHEIDSNRAGTHSGSEVQRGRRNSDPELATLRQISSPSKGKKTFLNLQCPTTPQARGVIDRSTVPCNCLVRRIAFARAYQATFSGCDQEKLGKIPPTPRCKYRNRPVCTVPTAALQRTDTHMPWTSG